MAVVNRFGMRAWTRGSIVVLSCLMLACLAFASSAQAAGVPVIESIEPPSGGASGHPPTTGPLPTIKGTTTDLLEAVQVSIYEGESTSPSMTLEAQPNEQDEWAATVPSDKALSSGVYTAVAEQEEGLAVSMPFTFSVSTASPEVVLTEPAAKVGKTPPTFSGTGSEPGTKVTVDVLNGKKEVVDSGTTTVSNGSWSTGLKSALPDGAYTVRATEASALGNLPGVSATYPFEVDTASPHVVLEEPSKRTRETKPVFSGTGSEEGAEVVVHVLEGATQVEKATTTVVSGGWSVALANALPDGSYHVYATEASLIDNGEGTSETWGFEVDTKAPTVTLKAPASRLNGSPSFSGKGSEEGTEVFVHVMRGSQEVGTGEATVGAGGAWSTGLEASLPKGEYAVTVFAEEKSGLGNAPGQSGSDPSEIDTEAPKVTLVAPAKRLNGSPTFSGASNESADEVVVRVMRGSEEVAKGKAKVAGGEWSTGLETALPNGEYAVTVFAEQASGLANATGKSTSYSSEVDTTSPHVVLDKPSERTRETEPVFSGTGSEEGGEVVVHVFEGATQVQKATTTVVSGGWSVALTKALPNGSYHVYATESSLIDNGEGTSETWGFEVDTKAPTVTLKAPASRLNGSPSFSGKGSEEGTEVFVHVMREGVEIGKGEATVGAGGAWSTGLEASLPKGEYAVTVFAEEKSGLANAPGQSATDPSEIDTEAPKVTLAAPAKRLNGSPTFSGTSNESADEVAVRVMREGVEVGKGKAKVVAGEWSAGLEKALPEGEYAVTVIAEQASGLGNAAGKTTSDASEVDTSSPHVVLEEPSKRTRETKPTFLGTGSEEGAEVVVHVLEGATQVEKATTTVVSGGWSVALANALPDGSYHVYATEASLIDNGEGTSETWGFEVDTKAPTVTLKAPASRLNGSPSFSGKGSEEGTEVFVRVMRGSEELGKGEATVGAGGGWSTGLEASLPKGEYAVTVFAEEKSGLGNAPGQSGSDPSEIDTEAPKVTLVAPAKRLNGNPTFSGTGSEAGTKVTVEVLNSSEQMIDSGTTTVSNGKWSTGLASSLSDGAYTVYATETSALGNLPGHTATDPFEVDTGAPHVAVNKPSERTRETEPVFSGTGSEEGGEVVVHVLEGATQVQKATTTVVSGEWSVALTKALPDGSYHVYATESSLIGNGEGTSETWGFEVDTHAPSVSLVVPAKRLDGSPSFSGKGSEADTEVFVHVMRGSEEVGKGETLVAAGGGWSTGLEKALPKGEYAVTVFAEEKSGLGNAPGQSGSDPSEIDTEAPKVTLKAPAARLNGSPSFSGTSNESADEVVVRVMKGSEEIGKGKAKVGAGGEWSTGLEQALPKGEYAVTVIAEQASGLGNAEGQTMPDGSEVDTEAPKVTLKAPASRLNGTPSFSGTSNESADEVVVRVLKGSEEVGKGKAKVVAGEWSTGLEKALPKGEYAVTIVAEQASGLGNAAGKTAPDTSEVDTAAPHVVLDKPSERTRETEPVFSGTGSEEGGEVVVHVLEGATQVEKATTTVVSGGWSVALTKALPDGSYRVYATEPSLIDNGEGTSETWGFEVDTKAPSVSLVAPAKRLNGSPSFSGKGSEEGTEVFVRVMRGSEEVGKGETIVGVGGGWSTGLEKALPKGEYAVTVFAEEKSGLGNAPGQSGSDSSEIDTEAPKVTLVAPAKRLNGSPSFSGTSNESADEVVVRVFKGSEEVGKGKAKVGAGGEWSTGLEKALPKGEYAVTVIAEQASGLGNAAGQTAPDASAIDTEAPRVTLTAPASRLNGTPSFSGTSNESADEVVVRVFKGSEEVGKGKAKVGAGGEWSTGLEQALPKGEYAVTVVAEQASGLGNATGKTAPDVSEIDTEVPKVTLVVPAKRLNGNPTFSGKGSEEGTEVVVRVMRGGEEVGKGKTTVVGGGWSTGLEKALPKGEYAVTVFAEESSNLGNSSGQTAPDSAEIDTEAPKLTLKAPASRLNGSPSFSGTSNESADEVVVRVMRGTEEVGKGKAKVGAGGEWSTGGLEKVLPKGEYAVTVVAEQASGLGNAEGQTPPDASEIDTEAPKVTLKAPASRLNGTPSFSGTSNESADEVVVRVLKGAEEVGKGKAKVGVGGEWSTGLEKALPKGEYAVTVIAEQASGLGNAEGQTAPDTSAVDTEAPKVTLTAPASRLNGTPTFSGTSNESADEVVVRVLKGSEEVGKGKAKVGAGGEWSTGLEKALPKGEYAVTVIAEQASGLGNAEGQTAPDASAIDTESPKVTLKAPAKRLNGTPSFSGTSNESADEVVVRVFKGSEEVGKGKAKVGAGGEWSTALEKALPKGEYAVTVIAEQASGIGNAAGQAGPDTSEIDTEAPRLILEPLPLVSNNTSPTFSGTSNESASVTVRVYTAAAGPPAGTPVATLVTTPVGGGPYTYKETVGSALSNGEYEAVASQPSNLEGNPSGSTKPVPFEINTNAPQIEMTKPPAESNNQMPTFEGTVKAPKSEEREVKVEIHEGSSYLGPIVRTLTGTKVASGHWKTVKLEPALPPGKHTYTAVATTESALPGNAEGKSAPATFVVSTEAPTVVLEQPASPTRQTKPTFSGTASEEGEVFVHVVEGTTEVKASKHTEPGGKWSVTLPQSLPAGEHRFTVYATEPSGLGNSEGRSVSWGFTLDTLPPTVVVTQGPSASSSDRHPLFAGTASDTTEVTVAIHQGSGETGAIVATLTAKVDAGEWLAEVQEPLEFGDYTAVATQPSSLGNETGKSKSISFEVARILPTALTEAPAAVAETHVALYGSVNPEGGPITSCVFEVGTTTAYGRKIECGFVSGLSAFPSNSTGAVDVFVRVYALQPNTLYHERLVAVGEGGTGVGADETFTTLPEEGSGAAVTPVVLSGTNSTPGSTGSTGVLGLVAERLLPTGAGARIGALLRNAGYLLRFRAPEAGTLSLTWFQPAQHPRGHSRTPKIIVATGHITLKTAGAATLKIKLTAAGRALLKHASRIELHATTVFTPTGGKPETSSGSFRLRR